MAVCGYTAHTWDGDWARAINRVSCCAIRAAARVREMGAEQSADCVWVCDPAVTHAENGAIMRLALHHMHTAITWQDLIKIRVTEYLLCEDPSQSQRRKRQTSMQLGMSAGITGRTGANLAFAFFVCFTFCWACDPRERRNGDYCPSSACLYVLAYVLGMKPDTA